MGKINIIIQREFNERGRKKSFIITTILTPMLFVGIIAAMFFIMRVETADVRQILVSDQSGIVGDKLESSQKLVFEPTTLTLDQIKQEKGEGKHEGLFGILVIGGDIMTDSRNVQLYTYGSSTIDVESAISRRISDVGENEKLKGYGIENLPQILQEVKTNVTVRAYRIDDSGQTKESSSSLALVVAYLFGFMIYMFVFMYWGMVMQ